MQNIGLILIVVAVILLLYYPILMERIKSRKERKKKKNTLLVTDKDLLKEQVDKALRSFNCEPVWENEEQNLVARYNYQNGHFTIRLEHNKPVVNLCYLFFFTTSMENMSLVRSLCNHVNMNTENERIVYSLDNEKNEISLHVLAGLIPSATGLAEELKYVMENIFGWQSSFVRHFNEVEEENKKAENGDKELSDAEWKREIFLLRQQELVLQSEGEVRMQGDDGLKLVPLIKKVVQLEGFVPSEMTVITDKQEKMIDREKILSYELSTPIIQDNAFVCQEATFLISYFDLRQPEVRRKMNVHLNAEKEDGNSLYFRVTITIIPLSLSKNVSLNSTENRPTVYSLLVAYDLTTPKQRCDEFLYMWKEAQEKQKKGEENSLTDEQRLISNCTDKHIAENLYRGRTLYLNERYYEALSFLEKAYKDLVPYYDLMEKDVKEKFFDLCYYIGFCYTELQLYKEAFFYLDIISGLHRITYTTELVNCLVNAGDVRAISFIDHLTNEIRMEQDSEDEELQEHLVKFLNFLKRRKAYVLVERRQFPEAKTLLNDLLEDPESSDFAINELAFIQKIESDTPTDTVENAPT